jgi:hypothetical protein
MVRRDLTELELVFQINIKDVLFALTGMTRFGRLPSFSLNWASLINRLGCCLTRDSTWSREGVKDVTHDSNMDRMILPKR